MLGCLLMVYFAVVEGYLWRARSEVEVLQGRLMSYRKDPLAMPMGVDREWILGPEGDFVGPEGGRGVEC